MKMLVFADLHQGIMPDARKRLETIIKAAEDEKVHFILNLGDFISNMKEAEEVDKLWRNLSVPHYIIAGNHDFDFNDEHEYVDFYGLSRTYYSFEDDDFYYIMLDTNFFREDGQDLHYANANFYGERVRGIGEKQLNWLIQTVNATKKRCIISGHAQIKYGTEGEKFCSDYQGIHELLNKLNQQAGYQKVCLVLNGHNHTDSYACYDGIHYLGINSASNHWLGGSFTLLKPETVYPREIHEQYPYLKYVSPFQDTLYAIVVYDQQKNEITVQGRESRYIGPSPVARGHKGTLGGFDLTPAICDRKIKLS